MVSGVLLLCVSRILLFPSGYDQTFSFQSKITMNESDLSYGIFLSESQLDFLYNYPQGYNRMKCFVTFLRLAVKEPTHYVKGKFEVDLTPGQFAISEVELAKLLNCNRKTAGKMAVLFHNAGLVTSVSNAFTTIFTIPCLACWYAGEDQIKSKVYSRHHVATPRASIVRKNNKPESGCNVSKQVAHVDENQHEEPNQGGDSLHDDMTAKTDNVQNMQEAPGDEPISNEVHVHAKDDQNEDDINPSFGDGNSIGEYSLSTNNEPQFTHPSTVESTPQIVDAPCDNSSDLNSDSNEDAHDTDVNLNYQDGTPDEVIEASGKAGEDHSGDTPKEAPDKSEDVT